MNEKTDSDDEKTTSDLPPLSEINHPKGPVNRVYARLDHQVKTSRGTQLWYDCVGTEWFDRIAPSISAFSEAERRDLLQFAHTLIVGITISSSLGPRVLGLPGWTSLEMSVDSEGDVEQHPTLIAEPFRMKLSKASRVPFSKDKELNRAFSFSIFPRANQIQLENSLSGTGSNGHWVGTLDVGKGACNTIMNSLGVPAAYVDFGGGVLANLSTFPASLKRFCMTAEPIVILSHWDWDHWSSAERFPDALSLTWVVPDQRIDNRPTHLQLATRIFKKGNLLIWPKHKNLPNPPITIGCLDIGLCSGKTRNDSGLALAMRCSKNERVLIPGDAKYNFLPSNMMNKLTSVVVSHHGAKCNSGSVPTPFGQQKKSVFSFGSGNTYGHATTQCRAAHTAAGWTRAVDTALCVVGPRGGVVTAGQPIGYTHNFPCGNAVCDLTIDKS
jgi:beta-lactamase superfamily II metal-dependent hydrolase